MSDYQTDASSFDTTSAGTPTKIALRLLRNGNVSVDWSELPRSSKVRHCIIHYKSLNNNRSRMIRVSAKEHSGYLKKIQAGHLYEVHVCAVDSADRIIASSERAQIQTILAEDIPRLYVTKTTPDFVWLEWEKPEGVLPTDIRSYKVLVDGRTIVLLPSDAKRYVFSDGRLGERYNFQVEMVGCDGKAVSSLPVQVIWPTVTIPKSHAFVNGCEELIISWGDSVSVNDGNIESYTLHLYDSKEKPLSSIGPNSAECRQVWIKDVPRGLYLYVLEIKLANSTRSIFSLPMSIVCGKESLLPLLSCTNTSSGHEKELIDMTYHLISIRDNMKSKRWLDRCEKQLDEILKFLKSLTDVIRINLLIDSQSSRTVLQTYRLLIDGEETKITMPGTTKQFPLELPRRDQPYDLALLITPDLDGTKTKEITVEASGELQFFCTRFGFHQPTDTCPYTAHLPHEKKLKEVHLGLLKTPQMMNDIELYDLRADETIELPSHSKSRRFSILLFYIDQCQPSMAHLTYFAKYTAAHPSQCNYLSINCVQTDIASLKESTKDLQHVKCYTDYAPNDSEHIHKTDNQALHKKLSLAGVPMYFVLDYSSRIVWKGRLCVQDQSEYNEHMDHVVAEVNRIPCVSEKCELCHYCKLKDEAVEADLAEIEMKLQYLHQQRQTFQPPKKKTQGEKQDRRRRVISFKDMKDRLVTHAAYH